MGLDYTTQGAVAGWITPRSDRLLGLPVDGIFGYLSRRRDSVVTGPAADAPSGQHKERLWDSLTANAP
jgi:hypothetical protein